MTEEPTNEGTDSPTGGLIKEPSRDLGMDLYEPTEEDPVAEEDPITEEDPVEEMTSRPTQKSTIESSRARQMKGRGGLIEEPSRDGLGMDLYEPTEEDPFAEEDPIAEEDPVEETSRPTQKSTINSRARQMRTRTRTRTRTTRTAMMMQQPTRR